MKQKEHTYTFRFTFIRNLYILTSNIYTYQHQNIPYQRSGIDKITCRSDERSDFNITTQQK